MLLFVSIFIVLSCEGKVLSRCRRERGFLHVFVGGCLGCVSIFFFLLVLEKAARDRRWRNDLLFSSGKTHRRGLPLQCALSLDLRREREREREKDTRRDDERQQRAPHRDDDRCGGRANATFNRIHFWIFLSLIEWSCLRRARKEARTSTRTTS